MCVGFNVSNVFYIYLLFITDRMQAGLDTLLNQYKHNKMARILLGSDTELSNKIGKLVSFPDFKLNNEQQAALKHALGPREISLIQGPPGM
jgi:hypothetical protein